MCQKAFGLGMYVMVYFIYFTTQLTSRSPNEVYEILSVAG